MPDFSRAVALAAWKKEVASAWPNVKVDEVELVGDHEVQVGDEVEVRAWVRLSSLAPDDVAVEVYQGALDTDGLIVAGFSTPMRPTGERREEAHLFSALVQHEQSGELGLSVRVMPHHPDLIDKFEMRLIRWA
jgi:starch phosphorylase